MERITKEQVSYYDVFKAADGTIFKNAEECEKYENSAKGVLKAKLSKFTIKKGDECSIFNVGCGDNAVWVCEPKTEADIDVINQIGMLYNGRVFIKEPKNYLDKVIWLEFSYDDDWCDLDTLDALMNRIVPKEDAK